MQSAQLILDDDRNQPLEDGHSPGVYGLVVDVLLELGDSFLWQLVERRRVAFISNAITNVSVDCILEYIEVVFVSNALNASQFLDNSLWRICLVHINASSKFLYC